jgi:TolA-binding protein
MKAILLFTLLALAFSARLRTTNTQKIVSELQQTNYGSALLHLVQLHSMAAGPVQELIDAIEELINDLNEELVDLETDFQTRTNEHNAQVIALEQDIQDAEIDIERADDVIQNLLLPRRAQLQKRIAQIQDNQAENRKTLSEITLVRAQEHEEYELQVEELNAATAAVDEALALLATLSNPSMLQVKRFQNSLKQIENQIRSRSKMAPMIKALISLASNQNFSDQNIVGQIVTALNEFRNAVIDSLNDLTAQEAANVQEFEERCVQLDLEHAEFQRQINDTNMDLTAVSEKLDDTSAFMSQRVQDRKTFVAQLELENTQYAEETEIYTDLKNEYLRELAVSEQALALVESADFGSINV